MKRFSYVTLGALLIGSGLLAGCDVPSLVTEGLTTGATEIVGSLLTWAFQSVTADDTTAKLLMMIL